MSRCKRALEAQEVRGRIVPGEKARNKASNVVDLQAFAHDCGEISLRSAETKDICNLRHISARDCRNGCSLGESGA